MKHILLSKSIMNVEKVKTYYNFSVKSGNVVFGTDNIIVCKKAYIILLSDELSENSLKKIKKFSTDNKVTIVNVSQETLNIITDRPTCKVLAITERNLAKSIKTQLNREDINE